jgi:TolB-like protein/tetratricopeptide (TPR) repeat protein
MNLLAELSRRNVIRVTGLYLVGAWLVLQVAETVLPIIEAPGWMLKAVLVLLALGVIPAALFAWVFELTPQGLKRESELDRSQAGIDPTARKLDIAVIVLLLVATGATVALSQGSPSADAKVAAVPVAADAADLLPPAQVPTASQAAQAPLALGIAVLPFANLSEEAANAFFAGGVHEEVLTHLSRIAGLRVISRTSMLRIAEDKLEIPAIGQRLGVSHVLEGSVRRADGRVRVTVQLIDAATDEHVWAENYDRTLEDVFAIQSEIALAIAERLHVELSPRLVDRIRERPTENAEAYDLYLRALSLKRVWRGAEGFAEIIGLLEQALQLDPEMLPAMTMLVEAHGRMPWLHRDPDGRHEARARELLTTIRERWPQRPEAGLALAFYLYTVERDYARALVEFRAVQPAMPNDVAMLAGIAGALKRLDRREEFLVAARQMLEIDPESPLARGEVARALAHLGRGEEAIAMVDATVARAPECLECRQQAADYRASFRADVEPLLASAHERRDGRDKADLLLMSTILAAGGAVEQALALSEERRPTAAAMDLVFLDVQAALLLIADGRREAAAPYATRAYQRAGDELGTARSRTGEPAYHYALAAAAAALTGDKVATRTWRERAITEPESDLFVAVDRDFMLAFAYALDGDAVAGWARLAPMVGDPARLPAGRLLSMRFLFDSLFGTVPAYRARVVELEAEL